MPLFWNLILRIYSGVLELELHAFFFLPITRVHGAWVSKCHCRSLKSHYKLLKNATIRLNSILRKLSFKRGEFLWLVWKRGYNAAFFARKGYLPILFQFSGLLAGNGWMVMVGCLYEIDEFLAMHNLVNFVVD